VTKRVAIFASGRGSHARALIDAAHSETLAITPSVVFSNRPEAPVLAAARERGVAVVSLDHRQYADRRDFDAAVVERLQPFGPFDGALLAGYMRIVTPVVLAAFHGQVLNVHPSLLPAFPGTRAVQQAWDYGVKMVGCTIHFVDEQVDHGPIVLQRALPVDDAPDAGTLASRLLPVEHAAYRDAVALWAAGRLQVKGRYVRILPEPGDG